MVCQSVCQSVCLSVCVSVCVLIILMYCAKMAESIEMPFRGSINHVLDGVEIPTGWGNFDRFPAH